MKNSRNFWAFTVLFFAFVLSAAGCSSLKMATPGSLAENTDVYPIERPKYTSSIGSQTWKMGLFTASNVDLGGTGTVGGGVGLLSASKSTQKFSFDLDDGSDAKWHVDCAVTTKKKAIGGFGSESRTMVCELSDGQAEAKNPNVLKLGFEENSNTDGVVVGEVTSDGKKTEITLSKKKEGSDKTTFGPTGYTFGLDGNVVGAIDVTNQGILYVKKDVSSEDKIRIAAASVALILYQK